MVVRVRDDVTVVIAHIAEREELLYRAMASASKQTHPPEKIIVSLDDTGSGAATTRNSVLDQVDTEWIAWLDDDDELLPNHLEACLATARETGADLVYPYGEFVGGRDPLAVSYGGKWVNPFGVPFGPEQERHLRYAGNFIPVTNLVRTSMVKAVGGFPQPFSPEWPRDCEDYGLLIKLLDHGAKFAHAPHVTWRYYFHFANTGGLAEKRA